MCQHIELDLYYMGYFKNLITKFILLMQQHPGVLAIVSFCSGVASYVLVERKESFAQFIAILLLISWLWLIIDNWLRDKVEQSFGVTVSPNFMRFALQMVQQESLFFALPFFLAVTQWHHPQALFTALIISCAVISLIDPLYYKTLVKHRTLFTVFHNFALFVVLIVILPILFKLTTNQSLAIALSCAIIFTLPSLSNLMPNVRWWRFPVLIALLCILSAGVWQLRSWVPPAALRLTDITVSHAVDSAKRRPIGSIKQLTATVLHQQGLYSWTAVKAPRGLNETIFHVWRHNHKEVDRIALNITGGREQGYRAWSHKVNFPAEATGNWQVQVVTESGQLIGLTQFTVTR
jgi:glycopeptide antibiotics resistance protein